MTAHVPAIGLLGVCDEARAGAAEQTAAPRLGFATSLAAAFPELDDCTYADWRDAR